MQRSIEIGDDVWNIKIEEIPERPSDSKMKKEIKWEVNWKANEILIEKRLSLSEQRVILLAAILEIVGETIYPNLGSYIQERFATKLLPIFEDLCAVSVFIDKIIKGECDVKN